MDGSSIPNAALDLDAYSARVGYGGELRPTLEVLEALHLAHATHVPFENLDILLGKPIRLDLESLQKKLVAGRRGGFCFEQNLLFSAVLQSIGFPVRQLAARVRYRTQTVLGRTHMVLLVEAGGGTWLADVGFGAEGLLLPVPFGTGEAVNHFSWRYRVVEAAGWALQSLHDGSWMDLYAFTLEPQLLIDYEVASHYTSTHPASRFVQTLTAQLPTPECRWILRNYELIKETGDASETRTLSGNEELLSVLDATFGLSFPSGTRFRFDGAKG